MPLDPNDVARLRDILAAPDRVAKFTAGMDWHEYAGNEMVQSAVERMLEIVGEAARSLSTEVKARCPAIPWRKIIAQRHVLAHEYGTIKHDLIWQVITKRLPELRSQVSELLHSEDLDD